MASISERIRQIASKDVYKRQSEFVKNWKDVIRWRNGYTYRNIKIKEKIGKVTVSVNVPFASTLDSKFGLFKDGTKLAEKIKNEWD
ncbi:MAG: hypothetical protein ACRCZ9_08115 [Fusobacteriaceae bacterium]